MKHKAKLKAFAVIIFGVSLFAVINGGRTKEAIPIVLGSAGLLSAATLTFLMVRGPRRRPSELTRAYTGRAGPSAAWRAVSRPTARMRLTWRSDRRSGCGSCAIGGDAAGKFAEDTTTDAWS